MTLLALDKSVRSYDVNGALCVAVSHISKAMVCDYYGHEIPEFEALGLDPDKTYALLRDPEELAKGAASFDSLQILLKHIPVDADDHQPDITVGTTGTGTVFTAPYLDTPLRIWAREGIDVIEKNKAKELSAAYRYDADMTPGTYNGLRYDGVMRNIVGNHVALVKAGRAGSDVVVGDSQPETLRMLKSRKALMVSGALVAHMAPKLATDAKVDFRGALDGVTAGNYGTKKAGIFAKIKTLTKGKLAQDADVSDVVTLLDALEGVTDGEVDDDMVDTATGVDDKTPAVDADGDKMAQLMAFLKGKLSDDDMAACTKMMGDEPAEDEEPEVGNGAPQKKPPATAMDAAAIRRDVAKEFAAIRQAEIDVEPIIGKLASPQTSAAATYKLALDARKVPLKGVPEAAYGPMVALLNTQAADNKKPALAQDAAQHGTAVAWLDGILSPSAA